jgi:hypothetical protein
MDKMARIRSYLEDTEKLCAKIDINKEEWKFVTLF